MLRSAAHALLLIGVAVLSILALAGDRGRFAILKLEADRAELQAQIQSLETLNRELSLAVEQLRRPHVAAEKTARETFGLLRPGETAFIEGPIPEIPSLQDARREPNGPSPR